MSHFKRPCKIEETNTVSGDKMGRRNAHKNMTEKLTTKEIKENVFYILPSSLLRYKM